MPVAGNPLLAPVVSTYPENQGKTITPLILAQAAISQKNRLINDVDLEDYATASLQQQSADNGNITATLILIYNATGGNLTFFANQDWSGHVGQFGYDPLIQNGQWCYLLHTHASGTWAGSVGCCVYRGDDADFFMGWSDPYGGSSAGNGVYVESRAQGHWTGVASWDYMYNLVNAAQGTSTDDTPPYVMSGSIGAGATPICKFILQRTS
ncbi:MAG TPA: hypothetical protein VGB66_17545 [Longimicrobium sp.]|jgi:hypothetical protein